MGTQDRRIEAAALTEPIAVHLSRRGRIVAWVSALALVVVVVWGMRSPQTAPAFFSWLPAQFLMTLSAVQTIVQLNIDQGRGLVRIGPETTTVWRVGGLPRRYESSRVAITADEEKGYLLVNEVPLRRVDLFDVRSAIIRNEN